MKLYFLIESGSLVLPEHLALNGYKVSSAGSETELKELCSSVTELDLAQNELCEWTEVSTHDVLAWLPLYLTFKLSFTLVKSVVFEHSK